MLLSLSIGECDENKKKKNENKQNQMLNPVLGSFNAH